MNAPITMPMLDGTVPYETIPATGRDDLLLLCDHASNRIPEGYPDALGLSDDDLSRHIAYDVGVRGVTHVLAERLGAAAVLSNFSRLLIDPNRGDDDPTQVPLLADGSVVPGNRNISDEDVAARRDRFSTPYHGAVSQALDRAGGDAQIISIHSFTPRMRGRPARPWQFGVLYAEDDRLARPLIERLRAEAYCVGDNEPYSGRLEGDTLSRHGIDRGLRHVLIEIRNDLIADGSGQREWAERLLPALTDVLNA